MNPQDVLDRLILFLGEIDVDYACGSMCKDCPLHKRIMISTGNDDFDVCDILDSLKRII